MYYRYLYMAVNPSLIFSRSYLAIYVWFMKIKIAIIQAMHALLKLKS